MTGSNWSVFTFTYSKKYYLTHPWKWIQELWQNLKAAWVRATKGYSYMDVWNWDSWFLYVVPSMFQHLAKYGQGSPCNIPEFPDLDSWHKWLEDIASKLISCREEEINKRNEYYENYLASFNIDWDATDKTKDENGFCTITFSEQPNHEKISQLYFARDKELWAEAQATIEECFAAISKYFFTIWD